MAKNAHSFKHMPQLMHCSPISKTDTGVNVLWSWLFEADAFAGVCIGRFKTADLI